MSLKYNPDADVFNGRGRTPTLKTIPPSTEYGHMDPSGGYHPSYRKMRVVQCTSDETNPSPLWGTTLYCHYNPKELVETYETEYQKQGVNGVRAQRLQFVYTHPRRWNMQVLFNDLGEHAPLDSKRKSTEDSLDQLALWTRPLTWRNAFRMDLDVATNAGMDKPPIVLVLLSSQGFFSYLTQLTVTHTHMHPTTGKTVRALVDLEFTEFLPSSV